MNKMREYERGREDGLSLALRIAKEGGVEALEREIKFRGVTGMRTGMDTKDLGKAAEQIINITIDTFAVMSVAVLHDEFGFGEKRCQRYMDGINKAAEYIVDGLATWPDYIAAIKEEIGLDLRIRWDGREVSA